MELIPAIMKMKELRELIDDLEDQAKALRVEFDQLRLHDIPNLMAENGDMRSLTGDFGRCTLTGDLTVKVKDKLELHRWLEESGNGSLIVPTVNAQTLKAFVKEQMQGGEHLPEEIITISPFVRAVLYQK